MKKRFVQLENPVFTDGADGEIYDFQITGQSNNAGLPYPDDPTAIINTGSEIGFSLTGGKNLIPFSYLSVSRTVNGVTFTVNEDGSITANGTATATATFSICKSDVIFDLPGQTVTLSGCPVGGSETTYRLRYQQTGISSDVGQGATFTIQTKAQLAVQVFAGITVNNIVFWPQLEAGTQATTFEKGKNYTPNQTIPYTVSLKDTNNNALSLRQRDQVLKYNNKWLFLQNTTTTTFNGTENWQMIKNAEGYNVFRLNMADKRPGVKGILCNYFEADTVYGDYDSGNIYVPYHSFETVEQFKSFLQSCEPAFEIEYELENTVTKQLSQTTSQQIENVAVMHSGLYRVRTIVNISQSDARYAPYPLLSGIYVTYDEEKYFEDIHLSDKQTVDEYVSKINSGDIAEAHALVEGEDFENKQLNAKTLNYLFNQMTIIQNLQDTDFKKDKIQISDTAPTGLTYGQVYFKT